RAVAPLEGGASDDAVATGRARLVDPARDRLEPRPPVLVGQRNAAVHFFDIGRGMEPVAVIELPPEFSRELVGDRGLARSGYAHDDEHRQRGTRLGYGGAAARSANQTTSPTGCRRAAGNCGSAASARERISRFPAPATRKAIVRLLSSAG